jgi:hypothetical protein
VLKASEHKSLRHLVNCAIAVEDERRSHEERMGGQDEVGRSGSPRPILPEAEERT